MSITFDSKRTCFGCTAPPQSSNGSRRVLVQLLLLCLTDRRDVSLAMTSENDMETAGQKLSFTANCTRQPPPPVELVAAAIAQFVRTTSNNLELAPTKIFFLFLDDELKSLNRKTAKNVTVKLENDENDMKTYENM